MEAAYQITRHNRMHKEPPLEELDAIKRLKKALEIHDWAPDLIIKAFKDLDTVFFKGRLLGNSLVRWREKYGRIKIDSDIDFYGITVPQANPRYRQVQITMNENIIFSYAEDPWEQMWYTMLVSSASSCSVWVIAPENTIGYFFASSTRW